MAPHEIIAENIVANAYQVVIPEEAEHHDGHLLGTSAASLDYSITFDNRDGFTPISLQMDEPYKVAEHISWAPRRVRVACIGAGAAGIMLCYKKEKEFGDDIDVVVYDRYPECGGVWWANRYPGCRCDVPSAAYQFSFAPKPDWSRFYSDASEIQIYYP